jgi:kynurenine formamidase
MEAERIIDRFLKGAKVYDLGRPMFTGMPQSPNHPRFRMILERRHGDAERPGNTSAANELIITGGHVGTHVDALSHFSHQMTLHGGVDARTAQAGGRFSALGIDQVAPMVCRGVLLDAAAACGRSVCAPGYEISRDDLEKAAGLGSIDIRPGDAVLLRTGWGQLWGDPEGFMGWGNGVPGPGVEAVKWLASHNPRAVGSDTIAFECIPPGQGHADLPGHKMLLVDYGIHIIETLSLEEIASAGVTEFLFIMSPLKIVGATGSPVRPIALVIDAP